MLRRVRGWVNALVRRDQIEREMDGEMRQHLARATERLIARGMTATAAAAQARREFGNVAYLQEEARDARGVRWIEETANDVRHALRGLRLKPGFAVGVIATLGLGVGLNATMFGIVDRLLLRPPAHLIGPDRSHHLYLARTVNGVERMGQASPYQRYKELSASAKTMDLLAAYAPRVLAVGSGEATSEMRFGAASASFWRMFDARPALGRFFTDDEDREPDGARVVVLSYTYWQTHYGGAATALGSTITIRPAQYTVIGVAPKGFGGVDIEATDAFIPIGMAAVDDFGPSWNTERSTYSMTWLEIYGRRKPGVSIQTAEAELTLAYRASYRREGAIYPQTPPIDRTKPHIVLGSMLADRGPSPSAPAKVTTWLLGVAGIVLLIACANIGNLLLARALGRRREIAVRIALGVSRWRLIRHLMIENLILAGLGSIAGMIFAQWGGQLVRTFLMPTIEWQSALTDRRVLAVAALSAAVAALLAGLAPVMQASRSDVNSALRAGARGGRERSRLRDALMVAQATLSVILLVGAGLFVRSVQNASRVRLGFDADHLVAAQLRLRSSSMDSAQQVALRRDLLRRAMSNPNVVGATLAYSLPFGGNRSGSVFIDGRDSTYRLGEFFEQGASPGYFATMGTRLISGRDIAAGDRAEAPLVVVVSEAMARALWPGENPIGKCLRRRSSVAPCRTVVGVAENVRLRGVEDDASFISYYPVAQAEEIVSRLFIRVRGDPIVEGEAVRRDLQSVMPASGYLVVQPMSRIVAGGTRSLRLGAAMFTLFGALALTIAAIGLYSVVAYGVAQRRHEVGIRIALGARANDVIILVVRDGLGVVAAGLALGTVLALVGGNWLRPLLFEVSPRDPTVLAIVAFALITVAVIASAIPALRAARVDPTTALRSD